MTNHIGDAQVNSSRILRLALAFVVLATAGWFLRGYTTDDTYIHLRYAHNLIERGEFSFNPGASSYGATSPLWIFGLALLLKLGLEPFTSAWLLGVVSGAAVILLLDDILERMTFSAYWRALVLLVVVGDPWFLRWTFSGMETPLATFFLLLLLYPLIIRRSFVPMGGVAPLWPRYLAWGAAAGLAGLVRPEFMVLAPAALPFLLMFEYFRAGSVGGYSGRYWARPYRPVAAAVGGWLAVLLPWFLYAWAAFGRVTPGTASAKSTGLTFNPVLLGQSFWQSIKTLAVSQGPLWVAGIILIVMVWFNYHNIFRRAAADWDDRQQDADPDPVNTDNPLPGIGPWSVWGPVSLGLVALAWALILIGGYAVKQVWIISRYLSPLSPVLLLAMGIAVEWLLGGSDLNLRARRAGGVIVTVGVLANFTFGGWVMATQVVPHARKFPAGVRECYLAKGEWLRRNTPEGTVVAALDIGAVGYASDRPVLDLMGLVSPEILELGLVMGFQDMVADAAWVTVPESTTGNQAAYFLDRAEGPPRWAGRTLHGVRFELLETCILEGVGLRESQPWTVALYRLVSTGSRVRSSVGG